MSKGKNKEDKDLKKFEFVLEALIKLKKEKEGFRLFFRHGVVHATGEENLRMKVLEESDISGEEFDKYTAEIITISNYAILENNEKNFIEDEIKSNKNIGKKVMLVKSSPLIDQKLTEMYLLYKTYKSNIIDRIDWEIITKQYDKRKSMPKDFNIAVIRLGVRSPCIDTIEKTDYITIECSRYMIDKLIENLQEIRNKLKKNGGLI